MTWWAWLLIAVFIFLLGLFVGNLISTFGGSDDG